MNDKLRHAAWLAARDQAYAAAREANRELCAREGHRVMPAPYAPICTCCGARVTEKAQRWMNGSA